MAQDKSIFYNSDYIVIEYRDLLKSPEFTLLQQIQKLIQNKERFSESPLNGIIKTYEIENLSLEALAEWYINRKHQNLFKALAINEDAISDEELETAIVNQINLSDRFIIDSTPLPLMEGLVQMRKLRMIEDIIIFAPFNLEYIKHDVERLTKEKFTYVSSFKEAAEIAKANSTYFLSNADHIYELKEMGYLKFSSITLPLEYRYNKKNMHDFKFDYDELFKENPFKLSYLNAVLV